MRVEDWKMIRGTAETCFLGACASAKQFFQQRKGGAKREEKRDGRTGILTKLRGAGLTSNFR